MAVADELTVCAHGAIPHEGRAPMTQLVHGATAPFLSRTRRTMRRSLAGEVALGRRGRAHQTGFDSGPTRQVNDELLWLRTGESGYPVGTPSDVALSRAAVAAVSDANWELRESSCRAAMWAARNSASSPTPDIRPEPQVCSHGKPST